MVAMFSVDAHRHRPVHLSISFQTFYNELSPYGDWLYMPDYGYVWRPFFDRPDAFRPYSSNGDWVYTDYGWTWVSDYHWGWAPFHYGRWFFDDYLGWMWIPGYEWSPAWVTWGSFNNHWGWAPLGPGINVSIDFGWNAPDFWWTFVPCRHFRSHHWRSHIYDRHVHVTNITYINNIYVDNDNRGHNSWYRGPRVNDVERHTRTRIRPMDVVQTDRPENARISNNRLNVYQPRVERNDQNSRPVEYRNAENVRSQSRVRQDSPRVNDPGMNRTREMKSGTNRERQYGNDDRRVNPTESSRGNRTEQTGRLNKSEDARPAPAQRQEPSMRNQRDTREDRPSGNREVKRSDPGRESGSSRPNYNRSSDSKPDRKNESGVSRQERSGKQEGSRTTQKNSKSESKKENSRGSSGRDNRR